MGLSSSHIPNCRRPSGKTHSTVHTNSFRLYGVHQRRVGSRELARSTHFFVVLVWFAFALAIPSGAFLTMTLHLSIAALKSDSALL